jgi:hypothetical protein
VSHAVPVVSLPRQFQGTTLSRVARQAIGDDASATARHAILSII